MHDYRGEKREYIRQKTKDKRQKTETRVRN